MRGRAVSLLLALAGLAAPSPGRAAEVEVAPILVELTPAARTALVELRNVGATAARFQVKALAWSQDAAGAMTLSPTTEVIVFPPVLDLAPGASRKVRLGADVPPAATERSYRLFFEELPPAADAEARNAVKVLTRIGIPVFLEPPAPAVSAALTKPLLSGRTLSFSLRATGNVRVRPEAVRVSFGGADGREVAATALDAWYVLAGGERAYAVPIDPAACPAVRSAVVTARLPSGELVERLALPALDCGAAP